MKRCCLHSSLHVRSHDTVFSHAIGSLPCECAHEPGCAGWGNFSWLCAHIMPYRASHLLRHAVDPHCPFTIPSRANSCKQN